MWCIFIGDDVAYEWVPFLLLGLMDVQRMDQNDPSWEYIDEKVQN